MIGEIASFLSWDDTIYLFLLLGSILFGHIFHKIQDYKTKQWTATLVGLLAVTLVSGFHVIHPLVSTLVVGLLITTFKTKHCHVTSFIFAFLYLVFTRITELFGLPEVPSQTNLIMMILTLKLVGCAFEVHDSDVITDKMKRDDEKVPEKNVYRIIHVPSVLDVFHYSFCYTGVLTGPYFTYRTYSNLFHNSYTEYDVCLKATVTKLKTIPLFVALYIVCNWIFPLKYFASEEFYKECGFLYRLWYMYPVFFLFRMRMYIGLTLSECVCTMAGLGLYPTVTEPRPGSGPSTMFVALTEPAMYAEDHVTKGKYSFECVHNIDPGNSEFKPTVRFGMRYWNMTVQYWLASYVYSRFPKKDLTRTVAVFFVSAVWHGVHGGYYLSLLSIPFYLVVEDMYERRFRYCAETISKQMKWMVILYALKMFQFSWWGVAFHLLAINDVLRYWSSVYFVPYILMAVMYLYIRYLGSCKSEESSTDAQPNS